LDGIDVFDILLGGIGVVHSQVADAVELPGDSEVEADGLGVTDVEVAVGFRGDADLREADLSGANFDTAILENTIFSCQSLIDANFTSIMNSSNVRILDSKLNEVESCG
jgi:uncharacterized protein YjbI with pentapeptide repeats